MNAIHVENTTESVFHPQYVHSYCMHGCIFRGRMTHNGSLYNAPNTTTINIGLFNGVRCPPRGLSCGVHTAIGREELFGMARKVRATVAVVENYSLMSTLLTGKTRGQLPELKAIVQYNGALHEEHPNLYDWEDFMRLGCEMSTVEMEHRMSQTQANHCAALVYTPGTTGDPKVVMLSHDNLTWSAKALVQSYKAVEFGSEHTVAYLPLSHIAAQISDIYLAVTVATTVHFAQPDALKGSLGQTLKEVRPTVFYGVPMVYGRIMECVQETCTEMGWAKRAVSGWAMKIGLEGNMNKQSKVPLPWGWSVANCVLFKRVQRELGFQRCKIFAVGGAITRTEVYHYLMSLNIPVMNFYGMSESCGAHCVNQSTEDHWRVGSAGKNLVAVSTKLSDTNVSGEGEICFSGRHLFMGYLGDPVRTSRAIDNQGWLHTGDIGHLDENGFLYVTGRTCEVIMLRGGESVLPLPIESRILAALPFLSHVVVVGDGKPYLSCLMTLSCVMDRVTGGPTDQLSPLARRWMESLGSYSTTVSGVIAGRDKTVFTAITDSLHRANTVAPTNDHKIQKWTLLDRDFSIPGGELGPTLKVRRFVVHKKYATTIETLYRT
ncbi:Long-chain-fatty-acid--CoA ligase ACSBG2 [Geodia barretti]|uniref:long-chain-fatty-acid--CoA ligase n=1 Tax=Geodia barretti TaxID=519541 RepID=A0AA35WR67_GEOBA|nr:Long-chain-fatty-acid--CoA ligase ACSBG2 [Geodia barretti]